MSLSKALALCQGIFFVWFVLENAFYSKYPVKIRKVFLLHIVISPSCNSVGICHVCLPGSGLWLQGNSCLCCRLRGWEGARCPLLWAQPLYLLREHGYSPWTVGEEVMRAVQVIQAACSYLLLISLQSSWFIRCDCLQCDWASRPIFYLLSQICSEEDATISADVIDGNTALGDESCAHDIWWHNAGNNWYISKKEKGIKDVLKFFSDFLIHTYRYFCSPGLLYIASIAIGGKNVQNLKFFSHYVYFKMFTRHTAHVHACCKDGIGLWVQQGFQDHIFVLHK